MLLARGVITEEWLDRWLDVFDSRVHPRQVKEGGDDGANVCPLRRVVIGHASTKDLVYNEVYARRFDHLREEGVSVAVWYGPDLF